MKKQPIILSVKEKTETVIEMLKEYKSVLITGKNQHKANGARNRICIQLREEKIKHKSALEKDDALRFTGYRIVLL